MAEWTVGLCDKDGNAIPFPLCKCGNSSDTCIMGANTHQWLCNKCLYGDQPEATLHYECEWGTSMPVQVAKKRENNG